VALDFSDNVYVTDYTTELIRKYDSPGNKISTFPTTGGLPYEPYGVALDALGNVYVTDLSNNYIHKYLPL
jgi:streptogramin lyase